MNCSDLVLDCIFEDSGDSSSSDDWNTNASMMELARQRRLKKSFSADTVSNITGTTSNKSKLIGPVPLSAELHRPTSFSQIKQMTKERLLKAGALSRASANTADRSVLMLLSQCSWQKWLQVNHGIGSFVFFSVIKIKLLPPSPPLHCII